MPAPKKVASDLHRVIYTYLVTGVFLMGTLLCYAVFFIPFHDFPKGGLDIVLIFIGPIFAPLGTVIFGLMGGVECWMSQKYVQSLLCFLVAIAVPLLMREVWHVLYGRHNSARAKFLRP